MLAVPFLRNMGENYVRDDKFMLAQSIKTYVRSEILVHRWGPGTRIYFGTFIVSSVALASSQYGSNYRA